MRLAYLLRASTIFGSAIAAPAMAQPMPAAPVASDPSEIIVTARKRDESLIDVPIAVTAVTEQALLAKGIASVADLSNAVPNVSFTQGGGDSGIGAAVIYIRGVGQNDYANSTDPGVGTYVDGVYLGRTIGGSVDLPDIAQVEVLRGPQGTLFGKNTMGGAINITSKRPSFKTGGVVQLTGGERNRLNLDSEFDLGLGDKVGVHGAFSTRHADGYVRRLNGGSSLGNEDSYFGRLKVEYKPTEAIDVLLSGDYSDLSGTSPRVITKIDATNSLAFLWNNVPPAAIPNAVSGGFLPIDPALGFTPYSVLAGQQIDPSYARSDLRSTNGTGSYDFTFKGGGVSGRVEARLSDTLTLRSITAYREFSTVSNSDQDGQAINWAQVAYTDRQSQFSQEVNLLGKAFDSRLDFILGAYYFREVAKAFQKVDLAAPLIFFQNDFTTRTSSYAGFAELNYRLFDKLTVTAGVRYTRESKNFNAVTACRAGMILPVCNPQGFYLPPTSTSKDFESTDPRFVLRYEFGPEFTTYASFSRGFKSGGFNARANNAAQVLPYAPEHVNAYEIGAKGRIAGGALTFSAAAFYYDYKGLQVTATGSDSTGTSIAFVGNIDARVKGAELELGFRPIRNLVFDGAVGYTYNEIRSVPEALTKFFTDASLKPITTRNKIPKTPEWTFNIGAELTTHFGDASLIRWRVDYARVSSQFSDIQNFAETISPAHSNLNARITYQPGGPELALSIYGKNLTDETYIENGFYPNGGTGAQVLATPNRPREIGAILRYQF